MVSDRFFFIKSAQKSWEFYLQRLEPEKTNTNDERKNIAKAAMVERLNPFGDLSFVDRYAKAYGQLPRVVMKEKFGDVMPFILLWKEQAEYQDRYNEAEKALKK